MTKRLAISFATAIMLTSATAGAQQPEVPYWASIKSSANELYMRVGPSRNFPIEWVYKRPGLPLKVIRKTDGWRRVRDHEGAEGWVSSTLLSLDRRGYVIGEDLAAIREAPADNAKLKWNAEPGVLGKLGDCEVGWCEFDVDGRSGYVREDRLWGAGSP